MRPRGRQQGCHPFTQGSGKKAGIYGMIGGQVVDVEAEKQYGISKNRLDFIYELKTGALIEAL